MSEAETRFSRATATAKGLGKEVHRFPDRRVLLTGETAVLATANGAAIAHAALDLLMRFCRQVTVAFPPELPDLQASLAAMGERIAWDERPEFRPASDDFSGYDAILSVGGSVRPDLPWTAITCSGWLIRVSSGSKSISSDCSGENVIGALGAAAFGTCEIFKRLIVVKEERGHMLDGLTFSLWEYAAGRTDTGPSLPDSIVLNAIVNGVGAIGSALLYLLSRLPISGHVTVVDNQCYREENWGTCIGLAKDDLGEPKALVGIERIRRSVGAQHYYAPVQEVIDRKLGKAVPWPKIVLNGLDRVEPRHEAQQIWPDVVIDGGIDADLTVQVSVHPHEGETGCLLCFIDPPQSESSISQQARWTGLSESSLDGDLTAPLTEADVMQAQGNQEWLTSHLGRPKCSVIEEARLRAMANGDIAEGFSPSVPFAACLSACLEITELVRYATNNEVGVRPAYQLNMLWGPQRDGHIELDRKPGCFCVTRRRNIDRFRANRKRIEA